LKDLIEQALFFSYRLCTHALLNWADDPALLAIVFC
jgi:hypothetical protein